MAGKTKADYAKDYTKPELREKLKAEIMDSDKGGRKGQWSARKSQLLKHEYESHGGGYRHPGERTEGQKSLKKWTDEKWQTKDGSPRARHGRTTDRYLPEKAWDKLSPEEKRKTEAKKHAGSRKGKQFVSNTPAAKEARKSAS